MEGREKSHMDKHKMSINGWNYDASCMHYFGFGT
jgi:hypothetical protein